jgi:histidinol-phosphate aminotransferase
MDIAPYVGGESSVPGVERVIRLASNENPLGTGAAARTAYADLATDLHRYPDGSAAPLRRAIAGSEKLDGSRIVCGAGSDELIALLIRGYAGPGDQVLHSEHGFLMYAIAAKGVGAEPVAVPESGLRADVDAFLAHVSEKTKLVFLANPNNPTGSYLSLDELRRLRDNLPPAVILVIDSAYAEYVDAPDYTAGQELVETGGNVVMTRTFSKIHGLAALRLGWAYCPHAIADVLHRLRGPFNVSAPAIAAGVAAIRDDAHIELSRRHNADWRTWFDEEASRLGIRVYPSQGNFLLLRFPDPERPAGHVLSALQERGILLRGMKAYGLPDCLRITIGTEEEMLVAADGLREVLS